MSDDYVAQALKRIEDKLEATHSMAQQTRVDMATLTARTTSVDASFNRHISENEKEHFDLIQKVEEAHKLANEVKNDYSKFRTQIGAWAAGVAFTVTMVMTLLREGIVAFTRS